jgi:hypothetical protein
MQLILLATHTVLRQVELGRNCLQLSLQVGQDKMKEEQAIDKQHHSLHPVVEMQAADQR